MISWLIMFSHLGQQKGITEPRFNIKTAYVGIDYKDKTVVRSSYHYNGNSYTGRQAYLYWDAPLVEVI